jgi:hypothetical protein
MILLLLLSIRLLPGLQPGGGYLCEAGCTRWGLPDSLVPGTVGYPLLEKKPSRYARFRVRHVLFRLYVSISMLS